MPIKRPLISDHFMTSPAFSARWRNRAKTLACRPLPTNQEDSWISDRKILHTDVLIVASAIVRESSSHSVLTHPEHSGNNQAARDKSLNISKLH